MLVADKQMLIVSGHVDVKASRPRTIAEPFHNRIQLAGNHGLHVQEENLVIICDDQQFTVVCHHHAAGAWTLRRPTFFRRDRVHTLQRDLPRRAAQYRHSIRLGSSLVREAKSQHPSGVVAMLKGWPGSSTFVSAVAAA